MPLSYDPLFIGATGLSSLDTDNLVVDTISVGNSIVVSGVAQFTQFNQGIVQSTSTGILNSSYNIDGTGNLLINGFTKANINNPLELPTLTPSKPLSLNANNLVISGNLSQNDITGLPETIANITSGNLGIYVLRSGDTMTGSLVLGNQSNPQSLTSWGTIKQVDPANSSQFIQLDATNDTLFFSNINAIIKGSSTSLQTENITNFEVIGGSFAVKDNATPPNFGGYLQINPNVANRTKIFHSGDRGLDIDGQTNNHQLRMTGFGNITMDNTTIFNQNATFKQSQFTEGLITIQPPASGNIQQLSATGITYSGSANTRIEGDASTLKAYQIGSQYPFSKVQSYQPLECDTINAVGNVLKIGNDNSTDEIQIGVGSNVHVLNILTNGGTEQDTLNIGSGNTQINFFGNTFYNYVTDHRVVDREIILNANSVGSGTSGLCGLWIRDNNFDAYNYFVVNSDRDGYLFRAGADPGFSNSHAVNLKCVNISGSSGKFLTCVDSTSITNLQSGSIVKTDLPASVAFLDNDQTFTGNQTYNCSTLTCNPLTELFINQISSTSSTFNVAFNSNVASASGKKFICSTTPNSGNDLTNKNYCDGKVLKSGDTMTGSLNINAVNPLIINTDNAVLLPRRQTGSNPQFITFQNSDGSASYGVVESAGSAGSSAFGTVGSYDFNIGSYTVGGDVNIFQQGTIGGIKMKIASGNTRSYNQIDMLNNKITNVGNPTVSADGVNKNYVDSNFAPNTYVNSTFAPNTYVNNQLALKYDKTGGTISGQVIVDNSRFYIQRDGGNVLADPYGDSQGNGTLFITGKTNTNKNIAIGVDQTNDLYIIQAIEAGINLKTLSLNYSGGSVDIGRDTLSNSLRTLSSGEALQLLNSGHSFIGFRDFTGRYGYIGRPGNGSTDFSINVERAGTRMYLYAPNGVLIDNTLSMNNYKITNLGSPTSSGDATSKQYVDSVVSGNVSGLLSSNNTWTGQQTFAGYIVNVEQGLYGNASTTNIDMYGRVNMKNTQITFNRTNNGGLCQLDFGSVTNGTPIISIQNAMSATTLAGYSSYFYGIGIDNRNGGNGWVDILATGAYSSTYFNNVRFCVNQNGVGRFLSGGNTAVEFYGGTSTPTLTDGTNQPNTLSMGNASSYSWIQSFNSRPLWLNNAGNSVQIGGSPTPEALTVLQSGTNGAIYQAFRNTAGSQVYGFLGLDSSTGTGLFGDGNNSFLLGTPTTNNVAFYTNNAKTLVLKSDNIPYDKEGMPIYGKDPYSNTRGQARWRDGTFTGTFDNTKTITNMANGNDNPITTGVRYTHTVIPDQNWIFSISGTYTGLTAGWYCFKVEWDDEIYMIANEVSFQATSFGSKNFPIYIKTSQLNFNMMVLNQSGAGSMAYRLDLLTAFNY